MARPVMVGVDGSAQSLRAVDWASDEAARRGTSLELVHTSLWDRYEPDATDNEGLAADHRAVARLLAAAAERAAARHPEVAVGTQVVPDSPVAGLLEAASRAALLVVGCRGRRGLAGALLGTVHLQVAARAPCPVVVVRGTDDAVGRRYGRLALGVDEADAKGAVAEFAYAEAQLWGSLLTAVRARRSSSGPPPSGAPAGSGATGHRAVEAAVAAAAAAHPAVGVELLSRPGAAPAVLLEAAQGADLVVAGADHRRHLLGPHPGPAARALLQHAPCPVAVVPST
ncbi:universal stress protein [Streptacidiphilus griseoplanus]|uniref:universal stress protein n=1 Tax=Peterkaempfera griseoplana TaxID=66896 RepID=UPI0006E39B4D|nr:universal stress protein [Peterkaempfera griseoplana]